MNRWALRRRSWIVSQALPLRVCSLSPTLAKLLDKAQRIQKNIEGGDGGEREMRLRDLTLTVGSSGQNYLHPSAGHQAVFLRWRSPLQDTKEAPIAVAQTVPQISLIFTSKNSTQSAFQNFPSLVSSLHFRHHVTCLLFWRGPCLHLYFSALVPLSLTSQEGQLWLLESYTEI